VQDLCGVREADVAHGDGLEGAQLDAAVGAVAGAVGHGHVLPGDGRAARQQGRLVGLDHQQVVGLLAGDQELGGARVRVECVGGDDRAGQVQAGQQRDQARDLAWGAVDRALGQHRAGGMLHRGQQMDLPAVIALGAPQRLAVDRNRAAPLLAGGTVAVGQPRAEHRRQRGCVHAGERAADGGLTGHRPAVGGVTAAAERGPHRLGGLRGPLGDRGHRPGTGQHRGGGDGGDGKDRCQRVAAAARAPGVVNGGQVGQQARGVGWVERVGVGEGGQGGWDRG
jgi:hypothetical protein